MMGMPSRNVSFCFLWAAASSLIGILCRGNGPIPVLESNLTQADLMAIMMSESPRSQHGTTGGIEVKGRLQN